MSEAAQMMTRAERALLVGDAERVVAELIGERQRQIIQEGWTTKHDERHQPDDFAAAAAAYAAQAAGGSPASPTFVASKLWPWDDGFKPKDQRRDLLRAGALIIAAIERLDREAVRYAEDEGS